MKKRILSFSLTAVLVFAIGIGAFAAVQSIEHRAKVEKKGQLLKNALSEENAVRDVSKENLRLRLSNKEKKFNLPDYLRKKGYYEDDVAITLKKYIDAAALYGMTQVESDYLISLCELGYDFEKLLDIYHFLQGTPDKGVELVQVMYEAARDTFGRKFCLENAYSKIKGWDKNALTMEEMMKYTDKGITVDEVVYVYQLSLFGNRTERDMLDARLGGQSWAEIVAAACGDTSVTACFSTDQQLKDIIPYVEIGNIMRSKPSEILKAADHITLSDSANQKFTARKKVASELKEEFCDPEAPLLAAKKEVPGVDEAALKKLLKNGYRIKDIKQAVKEKQPDGENHQKIKDIIGKTADGGDTL